MAGIISGPYFQKRLSYECIADNKNLSVNSNKELTTVDWLKKNLIILGLLLIFGFSLWMSSLHASSSASTTLEKSSLTAAVEPDGTSLSALPNNNVEFTHAVVRSEDGGWMITPFLRSEYEHVNNHPGYAAVGTFTDASKHKSYFGELHVRTNPNKLYSEQERATAVGVLEGYFTHERMGQTAHNLLCEVSCDGKVPSEINEFLEEQKDWISSMLLKTKENIENDITSSDQEEGGRETREKKKEQEEVDEYWRTIGLIRQQFIGLQLGSELAAKEVVSKSRDQDMFVTAGSDELLHGVDHTQAVDIWGLTLINWLGDLFDIKPAVLAGVHREDFSKMTPEDASAKLQRSGHCTAMVKVTNDLSDLLWGHSSWFHYSNMNRIYKHYSLEFTEFAAPTMSFSSYPGMLSSLDDFYLMEETSISVVQTTNGIYNTSLYDEVLPQALPAWMRVRAANALAANGQQWAKALARHNGGTYNNQYMVIDAKRFAPGQALAVGTLWVVEQIPGLVVDGDATQDLCRGYFPSYNVPYFPSIYKKSGYEILDGRKKKRLFSEYELAPRAKIFRRDQGSVSSLEGLKSFLRSNGFATKKQGPKTEANKASSSSLRRLEVRNEISDQGGVLIEVNDVGDPFALDPWMAICSRGDLNPHMESLQGCYDTKATSASLFVGFEALDTYEYKRYDEMLAATNSESDDPSYYTKQKKLMKQSEAKEVEADEMNHVKRFPMSAWVINGPTSQIQPIFSWSNIKTNYENATGSSQSIAINAADGGETISGFASHLGQPDVFDFQFELMAPRWPSNQNIDKSLSFEQSKEEGVEEKQEESSEGKEGGGDALEGASSPFIGGKRDSHGCFVSAGYTWCEKLSLCVRVWETQCPSPQ